MLPMLATATATRLQVGIGVASDSDPLNATLRAAEIARAGLEGATPHLALVVTAGVARGDLAAAVRSTLGPVGVAGGATAALLADSGAVAVGALVICLANADGAASGVAAASGRDLVDAGSRTARLVLAGWPFRSRYPRGLGFAFAAPGFGEAGAAFLPSWRMFMGPKLRTVCSVMSLPTLYGGSSTALTSVGCLEASYATGLGFTEGVSEDGELAEPHALIQGALEATVTSVKRLQRGTPRLVLVIETRARHRALGKAAPEEWEALRSQIGEDTPCVGWVCDQVAAYGRGVRPVDARGSLVVVTVGDPTPRET